MASSMIGSTVLSIEDDFIVLNVDNTYLCAMRLGSPYREVAVKTGTPISGMKAEILARFIDRLGEALAAK